MEDPDLFTPDSDHNLIAYSSPPNAKVAQNASISLLPGVYHQIEAIELEKLKRSIRVLITSIQSVAVRIESRWLKDELAANSDGSGERVSPKIIIFREDLAEEYQTQYGKPIKPSFFSNQLTSLKKLDVLEADPAEAHKKQPRKLQISSFKKLMLNQIEPSKNAGQRRPATNFSTHSQSTLQHSNEINGASLSGLPEKIEFSIQDIYLNGLFDPVMLLDTRTKGMNRKAKTVWRHRYPLKIQSFSDEDLMVASDQGLARQVFSLCNMEVQRRVSAKLNGMDRGGDQKEKGELRKLLNSQIPNLFVINEIDLAKLTDTDSHRLVNRDSAVKTFIRISNTRFKVDASENPVFNNALSWLKLPEDVSESEFLMRYWEIKQSTRTKDGLRIFVFAIDDHAFQSMLVKPEKPTLYKAPLSLAHEKIGLAHIIHNWVRKHGVEQQDVLFEKEFGIDELYKQLNISVDHPQWDTLSVEEKEKRTAAHKKSVSSQLSLLHKKHRVGEDWSNESGAVVTRSIFHGVEAWQIAYNSRNRKFRFRIDPTDQVIGLPGTTKKISSNTAPEEIGISVWSIEPAVLDRLTDRLAEQGMSQSDAVNRIYEWQLLNEKANWESLAAIITALEKSIDDSLSPVPEVLPAGQTTLTEWMPSLELKNALYDEAEQVGVGVTQAKFMVTAKADEFKLRYRHKDFATVSVIESQFYSYFIKGLSYNTKPIKPAGPADTGSTPTRQLSLQEDLTDRSWAEDITAFPSEGPPGKEPLLIDVEPERDH